MVSRNVSLLLFGTASLGAVLFGSTGCSDSNRWVGGGAGSGAGGSAVVATTGDEGTAGAPGTGGAQGVTGGSGDAGTAGGAGSGEAGSTGGTGLPDGGAADVVGAPSTGWPNQALLYKGTFTAPPKLTNTDQTTDAPLLGNGDLGVAIFGGIDTLTFNLHKNEFWSLGEAKVKAMQKLALAIPSMAGASYSMIEDLGKGEVTGTFTLAGKTIATKTWVQADDSTQNKVVTQFTLTGGGSVDVSASLSVGTGNTYASATGASADVLYRDVRADSTDAIGGQMTRQVRVATRVVGATGTVSGDKLAFTLASGSSVSLVTGVMSNRDSATYPSAALASIATLAPKDIDALESAHRAWWDAFFRKSFVEIPDKTIEKEYYASLYLLGSVSRTGEQAPGLWGNWVMRDAAWNGDYTLNYNHETPFYAAFPTTATTRRSSTGCRRRRRSP
jgi:alpha-L-fucosidase 2